MVIIQLFISLCLVFGFHTEPIPSVSTVGPFGKPHSATYFNKLFGSIEDKFQINQNSIIRTHDSRVMGAKYLNETNVTTNIECLLWCWNTNTCNLAVFDEKGKGTCYLFDCGTLDEFKCRLSPHSYYTSSVLQVNRNSFLLNEWKSQTNQENELTSLKDKLQISRSKATDTDKPQVIQSTPPKISKCRHYQFECRNNSECIAIYNVCDGIPQCSDGSDEADELECHKSRLVNTPPISSSKVHSTADVETTSKTIDQVKQQQILKTSSVNVGNFGSKQPLDPVSNEQTQLATNGKTLGYRSDLSSGNVNAYNYPHSPNVDKNAFEDPNNLVFGGNIGRVGPEYNQGYGFPWNQYSGTVNDMYKDRYNNGYINDPEQYGAPVVPNGVGSSYKDSSYWPAFNYPSNHGGLQTDLSYNNNPLSITDSRIGQRPQLDLQLQSHQTQGQASPFINRYVGSPSSFATVPNNNKNNNNKEQSFTSTNSNGTIIKNDPNKIESKNSNAKQANITQVGYSHISSNQNQIVPKMPNIVAISYMHDSNSPNGRETNSAVIALTLGLFITSILVVIVGCRMKSFKKRIARRGGRSLAHDADYLVNGLYL